MAQTMTEPKGGPRAAPVVQMLMGLRPQVQAVKQGHSSPATVDDFEREQMGVAAKE